MDSPIWVLFGVLIIIAITTIIQLITWCVDNGTDTTEDDGEAQENAVATEVPIAIRWTPRKAAKLHDKLERMVYDVCNEETPRDGGCVICLDEYCDGERRATVDACGHRFHALCIEAWLRMNNSCPLCRHHLV